MVILSGAKDLTDEERIAVNQAVKYLIENRNESQFINYHGVSIENIYDYLHTTFKTLFIRIGRPRNHTAVLLARKYPEMVMMCSHFIKGCYYNASDKVRNQLYNIVNEIGKRIGYLGTIAFGPRYTIIARDSTCTFLDDICYGKSMYMTGKKDVTWTNGICDRSPEEHEYMGGYFYLTRFTESSLLRHNEFLKNNNVDLDTSKYLVYSLRSTVIKTLADTDGSKAANNVKDTRDIVMTAIEPSLKHLSMGERNDFDMSKYYRYVELVKNDTEELDYICKLVFSSSTPFINPIYFDE